MMQRKYLVNIAHQNHLKIKLNILKAGFKKIVSLKSDHGSIWYPDTLTLTIKGGSAQAIFSSHDNNLKIGKMNQEN